MTRNGHPDLTHSRPIPDLPRPIARRPTMPRPSPPTAEQRIAAAVPKLTRLAERLSDRDCNALALIIEDLDPK